MIISEEEKEKISNVSQQCHGSCQITGLIVSYLEYHNPLQSTPHAPWKAQLACSCPAGETSQAPTASRIGSKPFLELKAPLIPTGICLSALIPPLQLLRALNLNLHVFPRLLRTLISLPQRIGPSFSTSQNHTRHSWPPVGAFFPLLKYSWIPITPYRTTVSFLRALKPGLCPPSCFPRWLWTPMPCPASVGPWRSGCSSHIPCSTPAPSRAR